MVHVGIVRRLELDEPLACSGILPQPQVSLHVSFAVVPGTFIKRLGCFLRPLGMGHVEPRGVWDDIRDALLNASSDEFRQDSRDYNGTHVRRRGWGLFDDRPPNGLQCSVDLPLLFDRPAGLQGRKLGFSIQ